jgi:hypothetical protein
MTLWRLLTGAAAPSRVRLGRLLPYRHRVRLCMPSNAGTFRHVWSSRLTLSTPSLPIAVADLPLPAGGVADAGRQLSLSRLIACVSRRSTRMICHVPAGVRLCRSPSAGTVTVLPAASRRDPAMLVPKPPAQCAHTAGRRRRRGGRAARAAGAAHVIWSDLDSLLCCAAGADELAGLRSRAIVEGGQWHERGYVGRRWDAVVLPTHRRAVGPTGCGGRLYDQTARDGKPTARRCAAQARGPVRG